MPVLKFLKRLKKIALFEWRYVGKTNPFMEKHSWTNGMETVDVYYANGAAHHAGFVVEVTGWSRGSTLKLSNGFVDSMYHALILADLYMRDDRADPAIEMYSDRIESDFGVGYTVRQDEWLEAHGPDYEFKIVDPKEVAD